MLVVDGDDLTGDLHVITPVVTTTFISSNKIENGDVLVLVNPGPPGKLENGRNVFLCKRIVCSFSALVGLLEWHMACKNMQQECTIAFNIYGTPLM